MMFSNQIILSKSGSAGGDFLPVKTVATDSLASQTISSRTMLDFRIKPSTSAPVPAQPSKHQCVALYSKLKGGMAKMILI